LALEGRNDVLPTSRKHKRGVADMGCERAGECYRLEGLEGVLGATAGDVKMASLQRDAGQLGNQRCMRVGP
jgi:hypothetical protein